MALTNIFCTFNSRASLTFLAALFSYSLNICFLNWNDFFDSKTPSTVFFTRMGFRDES